MAYLIWMLSAQTQLVQSQPAANTELLQDSSQSALWIGLLCLDDFLHVIQPLFLLNQSKTSNYYSTHSMVGSTTDKIFHLSASSVK